MPYQQVSTPRFFINTIEYLDSVGAIDGGIDNIYRTLPVDVNLYDSNFLVPPGSGKLGYSEKHFGAILGHEFGSVDTSEEASPFYHNTGQAIHTLSGVEFIANSSYPIEHSGFSIGLFNLHEWDRVNIGGQEGTQYNIGSIIIGTYYDMPHSPDLKLTMSREYGGTKTIETRGGASLSNSMWTKPPSWGNAGAWELYKGTATNQELSRSGRRVWDLSFSYLDDGDLFGANESLAFDTFKNEIADGKPPTSAFDDDDLTGNEFNTNILTDYNFYSQVIHKTNGGQLPFIFQPDVNDNTNFAICKFDQGSFKFDQVANGFYSCKIRIREAW